MTIIKSASTTVDLDDVSIVDVPGLIDSAVDRLVAELPVVRIISTHLIPVSCHYSLSADDGSLRDYHYNERGLVLTIVYEVL